jgi:asparagine synthase (glutamine-hydrolysing)
VCGIYGVVGPASDTVSERMGATLAHRGPDGDGTRTAGGATLGCRRLAIIDVAGGAQPLSNEAGDVIAVCNGEIYNHAALRERLVARGHRFRTHSDAEVLPHLYEEHGPDLAAELEGMFAFAIWDARAHRLVLARDRLGEKPLYHAVAGQHLFFASEPKAILATGAVAADPDWRSLGAYLCQGYVPWPASAFAAIEKLPPGGRLVRDLGGIREDRYWEAASWCAAPSLDVDLPTAAAQLRIELARAVQVALMSDVPLGLFLSGGLDSTAIAALARPHVDELATFSVGFDRAGFDELDYARRVAHTFGTRHRTITVTPALFLDGVRDLARQLDEPAADPAIVPTFLLSRLAREDVKAVLVGEGGDELLAGYPTYLAAGVAARFRRLPALLRQGLAAAGRSTGASGGNTTMGYLIRRFVEEAHALPPARHRAWTGCMSAARLETLLAPGSPLVVPAEATGYPARTEVDALLALDLEGYLPDDLLAKIDRAGMAASLEARAPFVNHRLVEFTSRLPIALKLCGLQTKRVLRRAMAGLVPSEVLHRTKRGLTVPLAPWLAGPLRGFAADTLGRLDRRLVRERAVQDLFADHVARRRDNRRELWALIMLQVWLEEFASGVR